MAINRALIAKQLVPGINALFGDSYNQVPKTWDKIFQVMSSDRAWEEDVKLGAPGLASDKAEGSSVTYEQWGEEYTVRYQHTTVAKGFIITEEAMEDNLYERGAMRYARAIGRSMAITKEIKGASVLNNAFTAGSYAGGDGKALCATDHPVGVYTNSNTASVDLSESALDAMYVALAAWKDSGGKLFAARPRQLIVPPALMSTAERLLKTQLRVDTANNDVNFLVTSNMIPEGYMVNQYLTDPDAWFIRTDVDHSLIHFKRSGMKKRMTEDEDTFSMKVNFSERYSFGFSDPLGIYGSAGA
ncbi:MAG: Mu-like prophage major head subunit gpT family protein [Gemmatimonadetes bacterium]|nr:Mu-like prophage major head subunit gpT family protein [Gemmatimonadota bacterium]